ncbi:MAG: hypothetical protein Q9227_000313 [Pyrenula ochraceoflavens]
MTTEKQLLILITGATGMVGFKTLIEALEAGYRARIVVRHNGSIEKLRGNQRIRRHERDIDFTIVPDQQTVGAFDDAVRNVDYIIHLANPIPGSWDDSEIDVKRDILDPAIRGSTRILESAIKSPSVKRIVMTSSIVALAPRSGRMRPDEIAPMMDNSPVPADQWAAYTASKVMAHHASNAFMTKFQPRFDLVRTMPAYVQGRNDLVQHKEEVRQGSNDILMDLVLGKQTSRPFMGAVVHLDDVARAHVLALNPALADGGDNFILAANGGNSVEWNEATDIASELFPDAVESGILPLGGYQLSTKMAFDVSNSETKLGIQFKGFDQMVASVVGQYVELATQEETNF